MIAFNAFQILPFNFFEHLHYGQEGGVPSAPDQPLSGLGLGYEPAMGWAELGGSKSGAPARAGEAERVLLLEDAAARVVDYGEDEVFEVFMRNDWDNCEMRTFLVAY